MKYFVHIEENTNKIITIFLDEVHGTFVPALKDKDDGKLIKEGYWDISSFPKKCIEITEDDWHRIISSGLNAYDFQTKIFYKKDFRTDNKILKDFKEQKTKKIIPNYESPTECLNINWVGGYESAQMLNAKRTLCLEMGLESCAFTDAQDVDHVLTLEQAKEVCIAVAKEFEVRRAIYKMKKRTIELCATIEELEAIGL